MSDEGKRGLRTISFTILVSQARNLCSTKGESFPVNSVARVNFLGETIDSEVVKDSRNPTFNFSTSIERIVTPQLVFSLLNEPLTVTLVENVAHARGPLAMGWAGIDLLPLVGGDSKIPLIFRPLMKGTNGDLEGGEVEIGVTASSSVMTHEEFLKGTVLTVFFDSVYSVPPKWCGNGIDSDNNPFKYTLSFVPPLPQAENAAPPPPPPVEGAEPAPPPPPTENPNLVEMEGTLTLPGDEEVPEANNTLIPNTSIIHSPSVARMNNGLANSASSARPWSRATNRAASPSPPSSPQHSPSVPPLLFPAFTDEAHFRASENANQVPRVKWERGYKAFIPAEELENWKTALEEVFDPKNKPNILTYKTIPLCKFDLTRTLKPQYADVEDPNAEKYHGEILVNLNQLLEPGVTVLHGRYKITHLNDSNFDADPNIPIQELSDSENEEGDDVDGEGKERSDSPKKRGNKSPPKRKKKGASGDETAATNDMQRSTSNSNATEKKKKKKGKAVDSTAAQAAALAAANAAAGGTTRRGGGERGGKKRAGGKLKDISKLLKPDPIPNPYLVARSYLHMEICLSKPLVPKIPTPRQLLKPSDYIPKRPPLPRFFQLKEATEEFNNQISSIVSELAAEYKKIFQSSNQGGEAMKEERRRRMIFELNDAGDYFVIKEKLKKSIVRIVKEKFQFQVSNTRNPKELEAFLNELYVYLIDQMHGTLQQTLTSNTVFVKQPKASLSQSSHSATSSSPFPPAQFQLPDTGKMCADEAELLCRYSQVATFYQSQVVRGGGAHAWGSYGLYAARVGDRSKAEECLREAIALDDANPDCLSAYGVLMFDKGDLEKAEVFLRAALAVQPTNPVVACLLVKLYVLMQREDEMKEMASITSKFPDVSFQTVKYLLDLNVSTLAEQVLSESAETMPNTARTNQSTAAPSPPTVPYLLSMGQVLLQQGDYPSALYFFSTLQARAPRDPAVWALGGHIHYMKRNVDEGITCYETALSCMEEPSAITAIPPSPLTMGAASFSMFSERAILLRLGDLYLDKSNFNAAKTVLLRACAQFSSAAAWYGTGVALYQLGLYRESEEALAEANIHDNQSPSVWGYLTLLCLKTHRNREATQAFKLALRLRLSNPVLLCDIGENYLLSGNTGIAEECARAAIAHYQEQHAARKKAQAQAHAQAIANVQPQQDRWQVADPTDEQFVRAVQLLDTIHKGTAS